MSEENKPQKPMSIEQAGNYLAEKKDKMQEEAKIQAKSAPISLAPAQDRRDFLMYAISQMEDVSESDKNEWCRISGKAPAMYSTKEVCRMFKQLLCLRMNGYGYDGIAKHLKTAPEVIKRSESLALQCVSQAIEKRKHSAIPIIGGLN